MNLMAGTTNRGWYVDSICLSVCLSIHGLCGLLLQNYQFQKINSSTSFGSNGRGTGSVKNTSNRFFRTGYCALTQVFTHLYFIECWQSK